MKRILLAVLAVAALVACSAGSGMEKELVGSYSAKPEIEIADSTDFAAQMAAAMLSAMQIDMDFQKDGSMKMVSTMGGRSQSIGMTWKIASDSLYLTDSLKTVQTFGIAKTAEGFTLKGSDLTFVLTPKAE